MSAAVAQSSRIEHQLGRKRQTGYNSPSDARQTRDYVGERTRGPDAGVASRRSGERVKTSNYPKKGISEPTVITPGSSQPTSKKPLRSPARGRYRAGGTEAVGKLSVDCKEKPVVGDQSSNTPHTPVGTPSGGNATPFGTPGSSVCGLSPDLSKSLGPLSHTERVSSAQMDGRRHDNTRSWHVQEDGTLRGEGDGRIISVAPSTPSSRRSERSESTMSEFFDATDAPFSAEASVSEDEGLGSARSFGRRLERDRLVSQLAEETDRRRAAEDALAALKRDRQTLEGTAQRNPNMVNGHAETSGSQGTDAQEQAVEVARIVSLALGAATARAEVAADLEKATVEIARLRDKLQYWERVSHEMAQARELAIDQARQRRRARQRRQWWMVGGSVGAGVVIVALGVGLYTWQSSRGWDLSRVFSSTGDGGLLEGSDTADVSVLDGLDERSGSLIGDAS